MTDVRTSETARRDAVPSPREQDIGDVAYDFRPSPPPPAEVKVNPFRAWWADTKLLNPRKIATRRTVYPLLVLSGLNTAGTFDDVVFRSLLIYIAADMGRDIGFVVSIVAMINFVSTVAAPLMGFVADRVKRVWMVRAGAMLDNVSSLITALAPNPITLTISRFSAAVGSAVLAPAVPPLLADYFPADKRARVFGFQSLVQNIWTVVSVPVLTIGVFVTGALSWRQMLFGASVVAIAVTVGTFFLREPVRGELDRLSLGMSADAAKVEQASVSWGEAWRVLSGIGTLRKIWYATPFLEVSQSGIGIFLYFAVQEKLGEALAGNAGGAGGVAGFLGNPTVARVLPLMFLVFPQMVQAALLPKATALADRLIREAPGRIMVAFGGITAALGLSAVLVLLSPNVLLAMPLSLFLGGLAGLIAPAQSMLLSVVIPARVRGQGFQSTAPFKLIGVALFSLVGAIASAIGAVAGALLMLPLLLIGAAILIYSGVDVGKDIRNALAASAAEEASRKAREAGRSKMIVMRQIDIAYDGAQVLFEVDFDVDDGELVAILGTNGAGKSTLLKAISGLHTPSGGAIFLDGEDITYKPAHLNARDGLVFLPGGRAIFPTLTVEENLRAAAWLYKGEPDYVKTRTEDVLGYFPILRERWSTRAGDLSGGEQQMLALGQAFLMKPRLLMIDELSLGLAPAIVERLLEIVRAIHEGGTTVLLVEQSVNVALTVAKRAVFLDHGRIMFDGPTDELLRRADLVRAVFLGSAGGTRLVGSRRAPARDFDEEPKRVLEVDGVSASYGGVHALAGVSLHVVAGEVVGIIGPNGAGKTTLFDVISGFLPPVSGSVAIAGTDATELVPAARARLGLARSFQDTRLFASLSVRETIAVALSRRIDSRNPLAAAVWSPGVRKAERRVARRVDHLLALLNLHAYADKFISELSTGTRRMVDVACVMALEPEILLLDEPSSGLAQAEIEVFGPVVRQLAADTGTGVLVIEHDIPLVTAMSDRLIAMDLGRVIAHGTPEAVSNDERVIATYLSASNAVVSRSGAFGEALETLGVKHRVPRSGDVPA